MLKHIIAYLVLFVPLFMLSASPQAFSADKTSVDTMKPLTETSNMKVTNKMKADVATDKMKSKTEMKMSEKINLNTATVKQLSSIKGIGDKKAQAIIDYRQQNGKFTSAKQLLNVKGIGPAILEKITPYLSM